MMLDAKSYAADTNSACKVEFTELKSSHTASKSLTGCPKHRESALYATKHRFLGAIRLVACLT